MGCENGPVVVYGFVTDIIFMDDKDMNICVTSDPGRPIYASIIIQDTDLIKVLEKMNKYTEENHKGISDIEKMAKEKGEKYNRKYECKWQLALCGELEYNDFVNEKDIIKKMSYDSY